MAGSVVSDFYVKVKPLGAACRERMIMMMVVNGLDLWYMVETRNKTDKMKV